MKSSTLILIFAFLSSATSSAPEIRPGQALGHGTVSSGRWQFVDQGNVRITIDWQIDLLSQRLVSEFRTSVLVKGFWHGFGLFSSSPPTGIIYALHWQKNDSEISWNVYHLNQSNLTVLPRTNSSDVTFQRSFSSGVLTVHHSPPTVDDPPCLSIVYFRGRVSNDRPLMPEEQRENRSLCPTSPRERNGTSTDRLIKERTEVNFFWIGRITNRIWFDDYSNFSSALSEHLRFQLQNLFIALLRSHPSLICTRFDLYSLQSGSILFAVKIGLLSDRSVNKTLVWIDKLLKSLNTTSRGLNSTLDFDRTRHYIQPVLDQSQFVILFERVPSSTVVDDLRNPTEIDLGLHLLLGSIVSFTCLLLVITTLLCLYGYYKCQRRQFRLFTEQQSLKLQADRNAYAWLGQQPAVESSSSPYLIQSTSI